MSKPATPNDPADVLDSIRRLVMDDAKGGSATRGRAVSAAPPAIDDVRTGRGPSFQPWSTTATDPNRQGRAKLLLTPDFMVEEASPEAADAPDPIAPAAGTTADEDEILKAREEISAFLRQQTARPNADLDADTPPPEPQQIDDPVAAARAALRERRKKDAKPEIESKAVPAIEQTDHTATAGIPQDDLRARVESAVLETLKSVGDAPLAPTPEYQIDEDALREMVGDIVKRELQGALGERITRNVRKLVRREIYRALEARNLD